MKLRQKFHNAYVADSYNKQYENYEKIADEHAMLFSRWKDENCYSTHKESGLFYILNSEKHTDTYTREELLEIYKKEKGL